MVDLRYGVDKTSMYRECCGYNPVCLWGVLSTLEGAPEAGSVLAAVLHDIPDRIEEAAVVRGNRAPHYRGPAPSWHCHAGRRRCTQ